MCCNEYTLRTQTQKKCAKEFFDHAWCLIGAHDLLVALTIWWCFHHPRAFSVLLNIYLKSGKKCEWFIVFLISACLPWNDDIDELSHKFIWLVCDHNEHTQYQTKWIWNQNSNANRLIYSPVVANALSTHNSPHFDFFFWFWIFVNYASINKKKVKCQQIQEIKSNTHSDKKRNERPQKQQHLNAKFWSAFKLFWAWRDANWAALSRWTPIMIDQSINLPFRISHSFVWIWAQQR